MENDRLKHDLDKSIQENRQLTGQMQSWKKQLTEGAMARADFAAGEDEDDEEFIESPEILKLRQEQAYRSVAALQLRVEELPLEVTKVY